MENNDLKVSSKGYGKRPLWQWVVIYIVIGGLAYGLIYYFVVSRKGASYSLNQGSGPVTQQSPTY